MVYAFSDLRLDLALPTYVLLGSRSTNNHLLRFPFPCRLLYSVVEFFPIPGSYALPCSEGQASVTQRGDGSLQVHVVLRNGQQYKSAVEVV